ncbi:MAG: DegT/DnrJ/EryC1/StrS family aminotransferase [Acidimicrobiia bacterium]
MRVPFFDLAAAHSELDPEIQSAIADVHRSNRFVLGEQLSEFEVEFARYVGARHCVGVGNGLDALTLALRASELQPGDEVLVPTNTFIATWLAVVHAGGVPVGVEPDRTSYNMDPVDAERRVSSRTRFIVPVHLYGQPADLGPLRALAARTGCLVVEDAAQAHGAEYRGSRVGSGTAVAWSFYPGKNLGALGDAGAVTTDVDDVAERLRRLRNYGSDTKYVHDLPGVNSRLDELQAAVLRVKLRYLDEWNARRAQVCGWYRAALADSGVLLPSVMESTRPVWHLYVVRTADRDGLRDHLAARGVETQIHYPIAPHRQRAFRQYRASKFPIADDLAASVLSLPMGPHMDADDVAYVAGGIREHASKAPRPKG